MRLNLIATLLFSLAGLSIAGLQSNKHFFLPALAPSMYDIGTLFGVVILAPQQGYQIGPITLPALGLGVYGLVYGTILGAALFLAIQIPGLIYYKFHWTPRIDWRDTGVQRVLALMGPRVLTMFCIQLIFLAQDNIASRLATGAVTALVYGWLFMQVPETLIGTAIGTVLLPTLSEQSARQDQAAFQQCLNHSMRVILSLTIPTAALLAVAIRPFVDILGFDPAGTDLVVWTARAYMAGLVGHALLEVAVRSFYARQDARTPLVAAGLTTATFILLAVLLAQPFGAAGIGLANTIAFTGEALVLWWLLNRKFTGVWQARNTLVRAGLTAAGCGLLVFFAMRLPLPALPLAVGSLGLGGLLAIPFVWPEVKLLIKL
jgi:putative peptidoglycan lipid II flippase